MNQGSPSHRNSPGQAAALEDLPHDELLRYGRSLGLELEDNLPSDELVRRLRRHRSLLVELDRDALLDVIKWSRRPVREGAGKEELVREIARITRTNYDSLSRRGLATLAGLREIATEESDTAEDLIDKLRKQDGFWKRFHRRRRSLMASWLAKMIDGDGGDSNDYRFLPEDTGGDAESIKDSLKRQIEDHGVVGGIASRLRGAADDYIRVKLDEIERRIDEKLSEIDQRLAEWRDREVANRLKILRITLAFTVLVAIMSLGYNYVKSSMNSTLEDGPKQVKEHSG